jgi:16S rRNA (cytosine967-C5)-methyltransferase
VAKTPAESAQLIAMPVSPARTIAFEVLARVESERAYAADLLHNLLGRGESLSERSGSPRHQAPLRRASAAPGRVKRQDAALATELVFGVLRWQRLLDFMIERQARRAVESLDPEVRWSLRLGAYQLFFLDRIPPSAAVNESVELVKRARKGSAASFVNAVLRRLPRGPLRHEELARLLPVGMAEAERLAVLYSHPTWMVSQWISAFGAARTKSLLEANNRAPLLACSVLDPAHTDEVAASLREDGLEVQPGRLLKSSLVVRGGNLAETAAYREGWIAIQDEASQAVGLLVGVEKNQSVLDLCSAPGNKTLALARAAGPKARIVASDIHTHRLRIVEAQLRRARIAGVKLVALDATTALPFSCRFERILVDAPCSGTGTLAHNPEIRWRLRPQDVPDLASRQVRILRHALDALAPGGRLVYATCSVEPEENECVVSEVVKEVAGVRVARPAGAFAANLAPGVTPGRLFDRQGYFRTALSGLGTDVFFAAVLTRD